jgi:hypothetical protein
MQPLCAAADGSVLYTFLRHRSEAVIARYYDDGLLQ